MDEKVEQKTLKLSELEAALNVDSHTTISRRIPDVIVDYKVLQKEKHSDKAGKPGKSEFKPPNTSNFRLNAQFRDLTELADTLKQEIQQCDIDDVIRNQRLEEVIRKTEYLASKFIEAENAYSGILKERETHNEILEAFNKDAEQYTTTAARYLQCGKALAKIGDIMKQVIKENKCFEKFIRSLAGPNMSTGASSHVLAEFFTEFETIESAKKTLTEQIDQALLKAEKAQLAVLQVKTKFIQELKFTIEGLITSQSAMEHASVMNVRYEKALDAMTVDTVASITTLARVLSSAEKMVENLISTKAVDHSFRKKSLAQQFEAIRENYIKKKAILHEYHKSKARKDKKKAFMVKALDREDELQEYMRYQDRRMVDLGKMRKKMVWMDQIEKDLKAAKREFRFVNATDIIQEEQYNPLTDAVALVDLDEEGSQSRSVRWSSWGSDDYDDKCSDDDEADLAVYCGQTHDDLLVQESEKQVSFMMAAESEVSMGGKKDRKRKSAVSSVSSSSDAGRERRMSAFFKDNVMNIFE